MRPTSDVWLKFTWLAMDFVPNASQEPICRWWLNSSSPYILICGGLRAGKSYTASALALACMGRPGLYWIVGPDYYSAREEFNNIYRAFEKLGLIAKVSMPQDKDSSWQFTTLPMNDEGGVIEVVTRSSHDVAKLATFKVMGILLSEPNQQSVGAWLQAQGRVSETGGFVIMAGTLEEANPWYAKLLKRWKAPNELGARSFSLPTWSNTALYPGGIDDPKIKLLREGCTPDYFQWRYGAEPQQLEGVVIPEFDYERHVAELKFIDSVPVELAIDPGTNAYALLFVQRDGLVTNVLDRIYERDAIVQDIVPLAKANPLWKHIVPGDAGVIDFAGNQRHANKNQVQMWQELAGISLVSNYIHEDVTIQTLRYRIGRGLCKFNSHLTDNTADDGTALDVLAEFALWERLDSGRPRDRNNHALKALGYFLVNRFGSNVEKVKTGKTIRLPYWGVPLDGPQRHPQIPRRDRAYA